MRVETRASHQCLHHPSASRSLLPGESWLTTTNHFLSLPDKSESRGGSLNGALVAPICRYFRPFPIPLSPLTTLGDGAKFSWLERSGQIQVTGRCQMVLLPNIVLSHVFHFNFSSLLVMPRLASLSRLHCILRRYCISYL